MNNKFTYCLFITLAGITGYLFAVWRSDLASNQPSALAEIEQAVEIEIVSPPIESFEASSPLTNDEPPSISVASSEELNLAKNSLERYEELIIPPQLTLVAGETRRLYYRNFVPIADPEAFSYDIETNGTFISQERRAIVLSPDSNDQGSWDLTIVSHEPHSSATHEIKGEEINRTKITLRIVAANAGAEEKREVLLVGDSLGHQSRFPNQINALLNREGNPEISFLGTHKPTGSDVYHEQYGGWTFSSFLTNFGLDPSIYHAERSPFVFASEDSSDDTVFDVARYLDERLDDARPDYVHIQLGVNDAFLLQPENFDVLDTGISNILGNAEALITGIRKALPRATISLGTVIPGNGSDRAYAESYAPYANIHGEWRWRQVQLRTAQRMMQYFSNRESENIFVVPTHLSLDSIDGYSAHSYIPIGVSYVLSHAVHPTPSGDIEVAGPIYAFLKAHIDSN